MAICEAAMALSPCTFEDIDNKELAQRHILELFRPYHAKQILDFVTEGQRRLTDLPSGI